MNQLVPFSFESHEIRVLIIDNAPWWIASEVCAALDIANSRDALTRLDDDEKGVGLTDTLGGQQEVNRKPEAKAFKRWITHEVIPSIRQTGSYSIPAAPPEKPKLSPSERERLMITREAYKTAKLFGFDGNMAILSAENYVRSALGGGVLAHMGATHLIADQRGKVYTPTELGQQVNPPLSAVKFNLLLESVGLQKREMGAWLLCDEAAGLFEWADTGKKHSNGTPVKQLRWFKTVLECLMSGGPGQGLRIPDGDDLCPCQHPIPCRFGSRIPHPVEWRQRDSA